jgi:hypothetical protein
VVTRRLPEAASWLYARVGRRLPLGYSRKGGRSATNARVREVASPGALRPTVYRPSERAMSSALLKASVVPSEKRLSSRPRA